VLDWEVAHLGDPHEDLGWLCMNAWRFGRIDKPVGGFGDRSQLYADYEAASGTAVDADRVRFWEVYSTLKWGVVCQWFASQYLSGEVRTLERAAIGRRVSETELDLLDLIEGVE
jgi:aminoglycoside phosphotransferase (APT) family kinase protein